MTMKAERAALGRIAVYMERETAQVQDPRTRDDLIEIALHFRRAAGDVPLLREVQSDERPS